MARPHTAPDKTARKTLVFLGKQLRTKQFALRAAVRNRNTALQHEADTRQAIAQLFKRIDRELDRHPKLRSYGQ